MSKGVAGFSLECLSLMMGIKMTCFPISTSLNSSFSKTSSAYMNKSVLLIRHIHGFSIYAQEHVFLFMLSSLYGGSLQFYLLITYLIRFISNTTWFLKESLIYTTPHLQSFSYGIHHFLIETLIIHICL